MSMSMIPGNYFVSHLILSVFEIPSVFVGLAVTHYFGRRCLGYSSLMLAALCFIAAPFCVHGEKGRWEGKGGVVWWALGERMGTRLKPI